MTSRWKLTHAGLSAILRRHGSLDAFGDGDFWLIDDDLGIAEHKLEVHQPAVLTQRLIEDVGAYLLEVESTVGMWTLVVAFEFSPRDEGLRIGARSVEMAFDADALSRDLGHVLPITSTVAR